MIFAEDFLEPRCHYVRAFSSLEGLDHAQAELKRVGIHVAAIDGDTIVSDETLFGVVADAFSFPDYFGQNWDALLDCLRDMEWLPAIGYVTVVRNADRCFRAAPATVSHFIEVCGYAASFWAQHQRPFYILLLTPQEHGRS